MLNDYCKELIKNFSLGFVATVTEDGHPSLSPKGTFLVIDDQTIAFSEIRSPQTIENLSVNAMTEVNFIDLWTRKGIRVRGKAVILERGSEAFEALFPRWDETWPTLSHRINAIVRIDVDRVKLMTTPPYDDGATEEEMIALYKSKFAEIYP